MSPSEAQRAPRLRHGCERFTPTDGPRIDLAFDLASAFVGAVVLVLIALTVHDYGITWDETWHHTYGRHVMHWYSSLFTDDAALSYRADYLYGGAFDGLGYLARQVLPLERYAAVHLFGACVGCMGLLGAWKFGRLLGGAAGGFATLVLLVLTPVWYGHMFNNPKDLPFAVGYVWALYYEVRILIALPAVPRGEWVKVSIALGVAMSVRIAGLLTLCYLVMIVGLWILVRAREARSWRIIAPTILRLMPKFIGVTAGAWALMLVFWPWAQLKPLSRPLIALARMSAFNLHERGMPFGEGRRISTLTPPPDYLLRYFVFKLPELVLVAVVIGLGVWSVRAVRLRRRRKLEALDLSGASEDPKRSKRVAKLRARVAGYGPAQPDERRRVAVGAFLLFAILFPPLYTIAKRSPLYDGLRHFLFLVPIFTVIAGVTLTQGLRLLAARSRLAAWGARLLVVVYCARMVVGMVHIHPHEYLWFNAFIGRLPGAYLKYSTDYYGNTYKEAFETLRTHLWETERERYLQGPYVVSACMPAFIAREYLGPNFVLDKSTSAKPEFWLGYTRNNCFKKHGDSPELTRVEREGTLLVLIRDLRSEEQRGEVSAFGSRSKSKAKSKSKSKAKAKAKRPKSARPPKSKSVPKPVPPSKSKSTTRSQPRPKPKLDERDARSKVLDSSEGGGGSGE